MININLLLLFIPTMFFISITPGMCMTLAMTMGMTIGIRRTSWMMIGEVIGVAIVATCAAMGVAAIMLNFPEVFFFFKLAGAAYLGWLGIEMWRSRGKMAFSENAEQSAQALSRFQLASQGFITAIVNPKGWAFFITLIPPFIDDTLSFPPQMAALVAIIVISEWVCMTIYALGGKSLRTILSKGANVRVMNRIAGTLMMGVGVWLALS